MNGLFSFILQKLEFRVKNLLARVWVDGIGYSSKTHQTLLVEIEGQQWLADVGFGGNGLITPILFEEGSEQEQYMRSHRIVKDPFFGYALQFKSIGEFQTCYAFTLEECYPMDYEVANHFTATHPSSFFTTVVICTKPTVEGRITLFDQMLKITANGMETETALDSEAEIHETLRKYFGIRLNAVI